VVEDTAVSEALLRGVQKKQYAAGQMCGCQTGSHPLETCTKRHANPTQEAFQYHIRRFSLVCREGIFVDLPPGFVAAQFFGVHALSGNWVVAFFQGFRGRFVPFDLLC
jgi:hypothetical protein